MIVSINRKSITKEMEFKLKNSKWKLKEDLLMGPFDGNYVEFNFYNLTISKCTYAYSILKADEQSILNLITLVTDLGKNEDQFDLELCKRNNMYCLAEIDGISLVRCKLLSPYNIGNTENYALEYDGKVYLRSKLKNFDKGKWFNFYHNSKTNEYSIDPKASKFKEESEVVSKLRIFTRDRNLKFIGCKKVDL